MATVYVSPTGSDSNTYVQAQSSATPWLTIGKCNTSATTGDTVIIRAGTVTWSSITFTKVFNFQGETADPTLYIISASGGNAQWILAAGTNTFKWLTFTSMVRTATEVPFKLTPAATSTITFTTCILKSITLKNNDSGQTAGLISTSGNGGGASLIVSISFVNCLIYDISDVGTDGVYRSVFGANNNSTAGAYALILTGCTIGITVTGANELNEVFAFQFNSTGTITTKNCIFFSTSSLPWKSDTTSTYTCTYTCAYNLTSPTAGTGNITSDPLLVDAVNGNLNLRPTSPCIGTGTLV